MRYFNNYSVTIVCLFIICFLTGCKDNLLNESDISLLTGNNWQLNSCINVNSNTNVTVMNYFYSFYPDGKYKLNSSNQSYTGTWQLLQDNEYLKIGNDIFRLMTLTDKLMILKYGEFEFTFHPL